MTLAAGIHQSGWREAPGILNGFRGRRSHVRLARPVTSLALNPRPKFRDIRAGFRSGSVAIKAPKDGFRRLLLSQRGGHIAGRIGLVTHR